MTNLAALQTDFDTDVLIVGAGPTGLTAAIMLAQSGVRVRVIERDNGPINESRAILVHGRTQEFFDKLGLIGEALEGGKAIDSVNILVGGRQQGTVPIRGKDTETPYQFPLIFEQSKTQRLLLHGLEREGLNVEWSTRFVSLAQDADGVSARITSGSEEKTIRARYVIGADGAGSPVRHNLGVSFEGSTYEHAFFLADVDMDWERGHEQIYANITKDYFIQFFPMYGEKNFRVIGTLTPEKSRWKDISLTQVQDIVSESGVKATLSNPRWTAIYRIHKRHTEHFRNGRVFLAGDAAHIHSPAAGQGMNISISDAINVAWKLAATLRGQAGESLLDSYEAERIPVIDQILNTSDRAFELQATTNPLLKRARLVIAPVAARLLETLPGGRSLLFDFVSQIGIGYPESPAVETADGAREIKAGERAPYGFLEREGECISVFNLFRGVEHQLLLFEGDKPRADFSSLCKKAQTATSGVSIDPQPIKVPAANTALHRAYRVDEPTVFLIRPDGYIGYRGALGDSETLKTYLGRFYTSSKRNPARDAAATQ